MVWYLTAGMAPHCLATTCLTAVARKPRTPQDSWPIAQSPYYCQPYLQVLSSSHAPVRPFLFSSCSPPSHSYLPGANLRVALTHGSCNHTAWHNTGDHRFQRTIFLPLLPLLPSCSRTGPGPACVHGSKFKSLVIPPLRQVLLMASIRF